VKKNAVLLVMVASLLWGTDSLFRRPLSRDLSPITVVFLEHLVLAAVALPVVIQARKEIRGLPARVWGSLVFIAAGGSVFATSLFTYAIKYGNPSVAALLQKTQPLITIGLARAMLGESPGRQFWYWVPPALAGAYLVSAPDWRAGIRLDPHQPLPPAAALVAASLWATCTVLGRYASGRVSPVPLTGLRFLLALPLLAVIYALQSPADRRLPESASEVALLVAMALGPGLLALILYYRGLRSTIAPIASVAELAFPLTAVLTNWAFLDIRLAPLQLTGGALLVLSITALGYFGPRPGHND